MQIDGSAHNSVGVSLLAIAVGQLNDSLTDTTPSRAGSLLHWVLCVAGFCTYRENCGSELARECIGSGNEDVECAALFASKLAPTGIGDWMKIDGSAHNSVGVSLLAIAVGQLNDSLTDTTPSRAGSLLHWVLCVAGFCTYREKCGSELARECIGSGDEDFECAALFASKLAPTGIGIE